MGLKFNRGDVSLGALPAGVFVTDTTSTPEPLALPNRAIDWGVLPSGAAAQVLTVQTNGSIAWAAPAVPTALTTFTATAGAFTGGIGVWGATVPSAQPATTGTVTGYTAGSSTAVTIDGTFTGHTGTSAYTIGDVVLALKQQGLLAS
jgi:hypothetical protein